MQNYDQLTPYFDMADKTIQRVPINESRVTGQRSWRIFYYVIWENGLLPTNMAASI